MEPCGIKTILKLLFRHEESMENDDDEDKDITIQLLDHNFLWSYEMIFYLIYCLENKLSMVAITYQIHIVKYKINKIFQKKLKV